MNIYYRLKEAGCAMDSHESDLYVEATAQARELTRSEPNRSFFVSRIDGKQWIELPFAYSPWREARKAKERKPHPKYPIEVIVDDRFEPTCGRDDCDRAEDPSHWVDIELAEPYKSAPEFIEALRAAQSTLKAVERWVPASKVEDYCSFGETLRIVDAALRRAGKGEV